MSLLIYAMNDIDQKFTVTNHSRQNVLYRLIAKSCILDDASKLMINIHVRSNKLTRQHTIFKVDFLQAIIRSKTYVYPELYVPEHITCMFYKRFETNK